MSATRLAFQDRSTTGVVNRSNGFAANSLVASVRATSPAVKRSNSPKRSGTSASNQGTTSKSVSMVDSGARTHAMLEDVTEGIRSLCSKLAGAPNSALQCLQIFSARESDAQHESTPQHHRPRVPHADAGRRSLLSAEKRSEQQGQAENFCACAAVGWRRAIPGRADWRASGRCG